MIVFFWVVDLLVPLTMIVLGLVFKNNPPRKVNSLYGYRTENSMKTQETWDYAQYLCGAAWLDIGELLLVFIIIEKLIIAIDPAILSLINAGIGIVALISPIPFIEHKLKTKFINNKSR
ncbi:MAG: sdpI/YhfL family protein [Clostridia bacterium]|nr:sdpI/YhfL family protein [Clostridia bacterium]